MRVPYTSRRKRAIKRRQVAPAAKPIATIPAPINEEEEDFSFIAIDDDLDQSLGGSHQSASNSSTLYPIQEQSADAELAVSILEGFFFGGANIHQKQSPPPTTSGIVTTRPCHDEEGRMSGTEVRMDQNGAVILIAATESAPNVAL